MNSETVATLIELIEIGWQKSMTESHNRNFDQREFTAGNDNQASQQIKDGYFAWQQMRKLMPELESKSDE